MIRIALVGIAHASTQRVMALLPRVVDRFGVSLERSA